MGPTMLHLWFRDCLPTLKYEPYSIGFLQGQCKAMTGVQISLCKTKKIGEHAAQARTSSEHPPEAREGTAPSRGGGNGIPQPQPSQGLERK